MAHRITLLAVFGIVTLLSSGCLEDKFLDTMKRENTIVPADPQANHTVYFNISDSGQTGDYTPTPGEDSDYSNLPAQSFTDLGNGTILDNITRLRWTKCSMGENNIMDSDCSGVHGKYTWDEARNACENLVYGSRSDWRMPTYAELSSLIHFGKTGDDKVAIDISCFPYTEFTDCFNQNTEFLWNTSWTVIAQGYGLTHKYWTASQWSADRYAHFISFDDGFSNVDELTNKNYVRCVSGP